MITPELKAELEKHKPRSYVKKVLDRLEQLGHTNSKNEPYDPASIRSIYTAAEYSPGRFRENKVIEDAIVYVFKEQKIKNEQQTAATKELTETFK